MSRGAGGATYRLIYDGDCGFCRASVRWVLRRDRQDRIRADPFQDEQALRETGVARERAERAAVLVAPDGRSWDGADAAAVTLQLLPGWGALGRFLAAPGIRALARLVYRWIADHRPLVTRLTGIGRGGP